MSVQIKKNTKLYLYRHNRLHISMVSSTVWSHSSMASTRCSKVTSVLLLRMNGFLLTWTCYRRRWPQLWEWVWNFTRWDDWTMFGYCITLLTVHIYFWYNVNNLIYTGPLHEPGGDGGACRALRDHKQLQNQSSNMSRERPCLEKSSTVQSRHTAYAPAHGRWRRRWVQDHHALQTTSQLQSYKGKRALIRKINEIILSNIDWLFIVYWL